MEWGTKMTLKFKAITASLVAAGAALISTPQANANAILEVISGSASVGSLISPGVYSASSISVGGWTIAFAEGVTQPASGSLAAPLDDIDSVNILKSGPKPLYIEFSAGGFTSPTPATMQADMSGVSLGGGLAGTYSTYYSSTVFQGTVAKPVPTSGLLTSEAFNAVDLNGSAIGVVKGTTPFALTQIIEITKGLASLDDNIKYVPVPDGGSTLILLGGAMTAMTLVRSKKGKLK
jgi:hypothetical protein